MTALFSLKDMAGGRRSKDRTASPILGCHNFVYLIFLPSFSSSDALALIICILS